MITLLVFVILMTVVGNLVIMLCVLLHKHLRRPSHHFVASLALADMLLGCVVMVPRLVDQIFGEWVFGHFLCQCYHAMDVTLCTASILHLSCISLDRYYAVVDQPLLYYDRMTSTKVNIMIAVCWVLATLTGFVPVFTGIYSLPEHLEASMNSSAQQCDLVVNKYFSIIAGMVSFWIPASVMVYVYVRVYKETQRLTTTFRNIRMVSLTQTLPENIPLQSKCFSNDKFLRTPTRSQSLTIISSRKEEWRSQSTKETSAAATRSAPVSRSNFECYTKFQQANGSSKSEVHLIVESRQHSTSTMTLSHQERESRTAITLGIVIGLFLVSWLPFFIWMPLTSLLELKTPPLLYNIILWIGYVNSMVNPFIYGIFSREFRGTIFHDCKQLRNKLVGIN